MILLAERYIRDSIISGLPFIVVGKIYETGYEQPADIINELLIGRIATERCTDCGLQSGELCRRNGLGYRKGHRSSIKAHCQRCHLIHHAGI